MTAKAAIENKQSMIALICCTTCSNFSYNVIYCELYELRGGYEFRIFL